MKYIVYPNLNVVYLGKVVLSTDIFIITSTYN